MGERVRDRYEPLEQIRSGPRGELVRALDHQHDRLVALRIVGSRSAGHREELQRLTRALIDLGPHPGLPLVREGFFEKDRHFLVSDWVEGKSLDQLLFEQGDPGLPFAAVVGWLRQVAAALDHMHSADPPVVHDDVTPASVIVTPAGRATLTGAGMDRSATLSEQGAFRAPERDRIGPTTETDIYALAATMTTLLTGRPPGTPGATIEGLPPHTVGAVERTLRRGLSPEVTRRPPTAGEMVGRLVSLVETKLPSGTVTFLLTDIEGSTSLWERHADRMAEVLARHDEVIADTVQRHGGLLLKARGEGDSTFSVFERAGSAIACAADVMRAIAAEPWPFPQPLRVRMALHTGEAQIREGDYFGPVVNRCARIRSIAAGGQVLVSEATQELVRDHLPLGTSLEPLGEQALRGLSRGETVYQVSVRAVASPPRGAVQRRGESRPRRPIPVRSGLVAAGLAALAGLVLLVLPRADEEPLGRRGSVPAVPLKEASGAAPGGEGSSPAGVPDGIAIDGSRALLPVTTVIAHAFESADGSVDVSVRATGSAASLQRFCEGRVDIVEPARPMTPPEDGACRSRGIEPLALTIAHDTLALAVSLETTWVDCLTVDEVRRVWQEGSSIVSWSDLRAEFPPQPVRLVGPPVGQSGARFFAEALFDAGAVRADVDRSGSASSRARAVGTEPGTMGLVRLGFALGDPALRALAIDAGSGCVTPEHATVRDGTYAPLSRPLILYASRAVLARPEVGRFLSFYLSEEGPLDPTLTRLGFIAVEEDVIQKQRSLVASAIGG